MDLGVWGCILWVLVGREFWIQLGVCLFEAIFSRNGVLRGMAFLEALEEAAFVDLRVLGIVGELGWG